MKVLLKLDGRTASGGAPLVCHNDRLSDPLDTFKRAVEAISAKRKKTEAEHEEMSRLEFFGGLYTDPVIESPTSIDGQVPGLPAWNILRCLQGGAMRHKRGKDVLRGVRPIQTFAPLVYDGPATARELWLVPEFRLRKPVGVQRRRVPRTRPMFVNWQAALEVEVDPVIFDIHSLATCWSEAGRFEGIGEMRPVYGHFEATLKEVK